MKIILNGKEKDIPDSELDYELLSAMAGIDSNKTPNINFSHPELEGTLLKGFTVKLKEGMIFNVAVTGAA